eukprot:TRINITY_DN14015_c0_g1_i1.p1 TRINITY_DN14015_c0_g1~~TRINITY_DN14015_c0_g1_i1.p1  ORF type:complete len:180 (+),score=39.60 TRINITY_DN14015_c0_g1_i1:82-621(+)
MSLMKAIEDDKKDEVNEGMSDLISELAGTMEQLKMNETTEFKELKILQDSYSLIELIYYLSKDSKIETKKVINVMQQYVQRNAKKGNAAKDFIDLVLAPIKGDIITFKARNQTLKVMFEQKDPSYRNEKRKMTQQINAGVFMSYILQEFDSISPLAMKEIWKCLYNSCLLYTSPSPRDS